MAQPTYVFHKGDDLDAAAITADSLTLSTGGYDVKFDDDGDAAFGAASGGDALIRWSTGDASNHALVIALGDSSQALHITDKGGVDTDWNVPADTHPTVYLHSNTTPATDYVKIGVHSGTTAWLGDLVGAGTLFVGFDGLECLELTETASAVNHVGIVNAATGNMPILRAEGEADTGLVFDNAEGEEILILDSAATSVNEITITSAATGAGVSVAATGDDANIPLGVVGKGTGTVTVGQATGSVQLGTAVTDKVGMYGVAPVVQPAAATQAAPAAYATGAFGLDSDAKMQALFDLVVDMRSALVGIGVMKGAA